MGLVPSGGVSLHVEECGSGYPIVFVHEFASDHREWEPQVRWFSRAYRCITYNARGYPPSDVPEDREQYGWEWAVADLFAVLDGLGIERAHVVGLSMGGYAVLQFGLRHPDRVSAIVAAAAGSGSGPAERDDWPRLAGAIAEAFHTRGMDAMAEEIGNGPTRIQLRAKSRRAWDEFEDVRIPIDNILGRVGEGHRAAQDRLGAGRIFHCMTSVGQMWRAFDLMVERTLTREVHGGLQKDKQFIQGFVADSYMDITSARLMTINAAEKIDRDDQAARIDISAIKVFVPAAYERVVDRAIQVWGAAGVSSDLPLAGMYHGARTLRIADGPDEVHRVLIAKHVIGAYEHGQSWDFGN
jgi:pimeloyl-ACP methyl ester carboxylesterase